VALVHVSPTPVKDVRRNDDGIKKSQRERSSRHPDERSRVRHTSGTDRHSKKQTRRGLLTFNFLNDKLIFQTARVIENIDTDRETIKIVIDALETAMRNVN
jgi:hypothetical protein